MMGTLTKICLTFPNSYQRRVRPSLPSQNSYVGFLLFSVSDCFMGAGLQYCRGNGGRISINKMCFCNILDLTVKLYFLPFKSH